jgi:uncharacterized phiE125 gp8 family phage protein
VNSYVLTVAPATEPVTTAEAKNHMRVDIDDDDTLIDGMIEAGRDYFEDTSRRALITQTWRQNLDAWPEGDEIELPRPPLQSVTSIIYKDEDGNETTLPSSAYIVDTDSEPGRIVLAHGESWPTGTLFPANPIQITFVAGYGDADDVPEKFKQAIKLLVAHWYEHREAYSDEGLVRQVPVALESLIFLNRAY